MYKFVLCIIIISATGLYGFVCSLKLTKRKKSIRYICDGIIRTKSLISFGGYEITRVIKDSFGDIKLLWDFSGDISDFFTDELFIRVKKDLLLYEEDIEVFRGFTGILGVTNVEGQIANCDLYFDLMKKQLESAEEKEKSSGRLYKILGFSLGFVITLMIV